MAHVVIEIFLWALGLCVGSFLNVVIYRLPRGLSISQPRRSFCPSCHKGIAWYDNLPILSWLLLNGRCRHCATTISVQYPLVEGLTGVLFVLTYHLLFVDAVRVGLASPSLPGDAPLLFSWLVLVAGLIACSAMDIVSYMIDTRITNLVLVLGIVAHAAWPQGGYLAEPVAGSLGAAMIAAGVVTLVMLIWTMRRTADEVESDDVPDASSDAPVPESTGVRLGGRIAVLLFVAVTIGLIVLSHPSADAVVGAQPVVPVVFVLVFVATVVAGGQQREADEEIHTAIEEEQPQARGVALRELLWLSPIILAGVVAAIALTFVPGLQDAWGRLIGWQPGGFAPIAGLAYSVHGAVVGAAAGWFLRIFFTLAFGKEAFGVGDIFILAAAGAAAGWDIALLGLLLSVGVALSGWIFGLLLKSTVMIPFGPWLAIGFLLALYWNHAAARVAEAYRINLSFAWQNRPDVLMMVGGLMLVGTAAAIALSRLFRRLVAPEDS